MDVIHPPRGPTDPGLRALERDLRAFDGRADPRDHRPVVVRRLLAAGAPPAVLDAVPPGWGDHLEGGASLDAEAPFPLSSTDGAT